VAHYQAAILGELARDVITIKRKVDLAREAEERLASLGYTNITVIVGDGSRG
jgi:protein-L-isoaspartate(D-aspartate) O-methyltransferase